MKCLKKGRDSGGLFLSTLAWNWPEKCPIREIYEHLNWLEEKIKRALAKSLSVSHDRPPPNTDAHAQQLMHLEAEARGFRETIAQGCVSGLKESRKELLQNLASYKKTLAQMTNRGKMMTPEKKMPS
jgi:hypothetical protein